MSSRRFAILARSRTAFTVSSSPLNAVKLELAIVICGAVLIAACQALWIETALAQVLVLGAYGCLAAAWLVCRARSVVSAVCADAATQAGADGQE